MCQQRSRGRFTRVVIFLKLSGIASLAILAGCSIAEIKEIDPHVSVAPKAVMIAESPTITTTVPVAKMLDFRPQVKMPKGLVQIRTAPITFRPVMDVKPGAIAPTITVIVPKDAFHFELHVAPWSVVVQPKVDIASGAIQVGTLEKGAVNVAGILPLWAYVVMGGLAVGWAITKVRRHEQARALVNRPRSLLNGPF